MAEFTAGSTDELLDSLTPYEIAILSFTSPDSVTSSGERQLVTLTCKETYYLAGAIAHAVVHNRELGGDAVVSLLERALSETLDRHTHYGRRDLWHALQAHVEVIDAFLRLADIREDRDLIQRRTQDAVESLVWRGYIEDPFSKKIGAAILSVVLVMPVSFTSKGPDDVHLNALTWEYVQRSEDHRSQRELRFKVKEISDVVINKLVPASVAAVAKLSGTDSGQGMTDRDAQIKLAQLKYYDGAIDGKIGPRTITALRRFQRDQYLEVTGYLDEATLRRLKSIY